MTLLKLHQGDCFEFLPQLEKNSVDCIITDPPYFFDTMCDQWKLRKSNSHIKNLSCGMKFSRKQSEQFSLFMETLGTQCYNCLKPGSFFLAFSTPRLYHSLAQGLEKAGFEIRDQICWKYKRSQVKAFRQNHIIDRDTQMNEQEKTLLKKELENHRTPQLKPNYESICVAMKPLEKRFLDNYRNYGTGLIYVNPDSAFPSNVMEFSKPSTLEKKKDENTHPTVKPVDLIEKLIEIFCPAQGTLLDPFLGSGTTFVAAQNRDIYQCLGCEQKEEYCKIILKRCDVSSELV